MEREKTPGQDRRKSSASRAPMLLLPIWPANEAATPRTFFLLLFRFVFLGRGRKVAANVGRPRDLGGKVGSGAEAVEADSAEFRGS